MRDLTFEPETISEHVLVCRSLESARDWWRFMSELARQIDDVAIQFKATTEHGASVTIWYRVASTKASARKWNDALEQSGVKRETILP
jgi:hypothetical protein